MAETRGGRLALNGAYYLMPDAMSLAFLETAVRHSRHYDLSLQFVTQIGGEFVLTPEARTIASPCSMPLIHGSISDRRARRMV